MKNIFKRAMALTIIVVTVIAMTMPAYAASSKDRTSEVDYISDLKTTYGTMKSAKYNDDIFVEGIDASCNTGWLFFDFNKSVTIGIGLVNDSGKVTEKNSAYCEMYYGMKANIENNRYLTVKSYSHLKDVTLKSIDIYARTKSCYDSPVFTFDKKTGTLKADLYNNCYINGMYGIKAVYSKNKILQSCNLYLYVNCKSNNPSDYEFYLCKGIKGFDFKHDTNPVDRQKALQELIKSENITVEKAKTSDFAYPVSLDSDAPYWRTKSDEIVKNNKNASTEYKMTLIHDWMTKNLAYNNYKHKTGNMLWALDKNKNVINSHKVANSKTPIHAYYTDRNYYTSKTHIGVCADFSEIFTIMCRQQNIPCVILRHDTHEWVAVYLNGKWVEVDMTTDIQRKSEAKDGSDVDWSPNNKMDYRYTGFLDYKKSNTLKAVDVSMYKD